jgi:NAD(P)-dependent dehydrogenase (short-subunit alcohol dehydrogenase family)
VTSPTSLVATAGTRIDGLANVAGIYDGHLPTAEVDDATWDRVFAVNVTAMMKLTRATLPLMLKAGRGAIVNVSSEAGMRGSCAGTAYTAAKHAVIGFTRSTAFFYTPQGVRCNVVPPGPVSTNIALGPHTSEWAGERLSALFGAILPPVADPAELSSAITWLLSEDSSNVSGAVLAVDGGMAAI